MPIIVATTVVTLDVMLVAVFVTTFWTPPMSLLMRDCTSPVRVRVKKASERRCRWRKTAARRSCMTRCPTWFESSVWITPRMPATIAITIIAAALTETPRVSCASIATRTRRSRNAGSTPRPALTTISPSSPESRRQYGLKSRPIRRMFARRTSGSAGRSGGASPRSWKNIPIRALQRARLVTPPTRGELLRVELLRGIERLAGARRRLAPESAEQHPLAREPDQTQLALGRVGDAFRVEVQIDGDLLDEPGVARVRPLPARAGRRRARRAPGARGRRYGR